MSRVPQQLAFGYSETNGHSGSAKRYGITTEWIADETGHTYMMRYSRGELSVTVERNPLDRELFMVHRHGDGKVMPGEACTTILEANRLVRRWLLDADELAAVVHPFTGGRAWCGKRPAKRYQKR